MKKTEVAEILVGHHWVKSVDRGVDLLNLLDKVGMLAPWRDDESPLGYGAAYLSDEDILKNYFKFKHSWEESNE